MKKKSKKTLIALSAAAAAALIYAVSVNAAVVITTGGSIVGTDAAESFGADCILVLGAGLRPDGSPSDMLEDRLRTAVTLYEAGAAPCILMSGDHSRKDYDEVGAMMKFAAELGVPEEALVPDYAGFSTYESIYRARDIFSAKKVIIVTQKYLLHRALYIAGRLGVGAVGVSADLRGYRGQLMREAREVLARNKDFIWTLIQPEPTYLGEKLPLRTENAE